jgi:hypothetical protein
MLSVNYSFQWLVKVFVHMIDNYNEHIHDVIDPTNCSTTTRFLKSRRIWCSLGSEKRDGTPKLSWCRFGIHGFEVNKRELIKAIRRDSWTKHHGAPWGAMGRNAPTLGTCQARTMVP